MTPSRTIQCAESGHDSTFFRRSASEELLTRDGACAKKGHQCEGPRGKKMSSLVTLPIKLSPPASSYRTTAWRRFQLHAFPARHTCGPGVAASNCILNSNTPQAITPATQARSSMRTTRSLWYHRAYVMGLFGLAWTVKRT